MENCNRRKLKRAASDAIACAAYDPGKLILIHAGAMVVLTLILLLVDQLLDQQISGTGGLSGVGTRSLLETLQTVLWGGQIVAVLFWQIGYVYAAMQIFRREPVGVRSLLEGFRQFFPVLRLRLLLALLYGGIVMLSVYVSSILFSLLPWSDTLVEAYEIGTDEALLSAMDALMLPMLGVMAAVMLVLVVPYAYRLRLTEYVLMDEPRAGAGNAVRKSRAMMRGKRMELFKLDMSFWWFYALEILTAMVGYGDILLPMFGVTLPWSDTVSYYVFLVLCYVAQMALYWWRGNQIRVTYAGFYEQLLPKPECE